jgi:predicted transcriptional regulator
MKNYSREDHKEIILSLIPQMREEAIPGPELSRLTHLTPRAIRELVTELRIEYPICSKETEGGGYWMAENEQDIIEFVKMIERRRNAHSKTIEVMSHHIFNKGK